MRESVKIDKRASNQKTISMSKFGSRIELNPLQVNRKNTSSLVNEILSKNKVNKKLVQHHQGFKLKKSKK